MKSLDAGFDRRLPLTHALVRTVRTLGELKGREDLFLAQAPQVLETLRQVAVIQSIESSNRIEGVVAPSGRIRALAAEKTKPRDRSEQEITGYRDVLNTIHTNSRRMKLTSGLVQQFHRDLFRFTSTGGGKWKSAQNVIIERSAGGTERLRFRPVEPQHVAGAMEELHRQWISRLEAGQVDPLLLIPAYVLDFLCIHPFMDGNGRVSRLLTLLLLYQAGFGVGRYIPLEKLIEDSKEGYYSALHASSKGWHEGRHTLVPWTEYLLGIVTAAYRDFEGRVGSMTTARGAKSGMVIEAIRRFHGDFSVGELTEQVPNASIDLIRRILNREREAGRVECLGRGPAARWRRI